MIAAYTLWRREIVRFLRQKNRLIGAAATPLVFWWLIGSGLGSSFQSAGTPSGATYLHYFFPGTILLMVLFTAIFSTISIIEDRREGFLQGVLVAPGSRSAIVWGKILGGATLATGQGLLFVLLGLGLGLSFSLCGVILLVGTLFLLGLALTALGYLIAWPLDSTQGFHALMNLVLMPLWLLSGALFPPAGAAGWMKICMQLNPLYYGLEALRSLLLSASESAPSLFVCYGVLSVFMVILITLCLQITSRYAGKNP